MGNSKDVGGRLSLKGKKKERERNERRKSLKRENGIHENVGRQSRREAEKKGGTKLKSELLPNYCK